LNFGQLINLSLGREDFIHLDWNECITLQSLHARFLSSSYLAFCLSLKPEEKAASGELDFDVSTAATIALAPFLD